MPAEGTAKKKIAAVLFLAVMLLVTACGQESAAKKDRYEELYANRTEYAGDAVKMNALAENMNYADLKESISLHTDSEPLGVKVNYASVPEDMTVDGEVVVTDCLLENAAVYFALADNLDKVTFNFVKAEFSFGRDYLEDQLGVDLGDYSGTYESFRSGLIFLLENETWEKTDFPVRLTDIWRLYVWRDPEKPDGEAVLYSFFPGMNFPEPEELIYDRAFVLDSVEAVNEKLADCEGLRFLDIRQSYSLSKAEMEEIYSRIEFPGGNYSSATGYFGAEPKNESGAADAEEVAGLLDIIVSSPMESSNPKDYILEHGKEYETILKMGDGALDVLLAEFAAGNTEGLRAHIMMLLAQEILGPRDNVSSEEYTTPGEWYSLLDIREKVLLPSFTLRTGEENEDMVYAALEAEVPGDPYRVTLYAAEIYGSLQTEDEYRIFATVFDKTFAMYGNVLDEDGAGIVPMAVVYGIDSEGEYSFREIIRARDGSDFCSSIEEFCLERGDIAAEMLEGYGNHEKLHVKLNSNIMLYLRESGLEDAQVRRYDGSIVSTDEAFGETES